MGATNALVANSVAVYDVDHALLLAGGAGAQFLKSSVNLAGAFSKSQAGGIIAIRLRQELGGITAAEWKAARSVQLRTTLLALNAERLDDAKGGNRVTPEVDKRHLSV